MVVLAVELHQRCLEVGAYAGKDGTQVVEHVLRKDATPVFCDEDQMDMKREYAMSAPANIIVFHNRPTIIRA